MIPRFLSVVLLLLVLPPMSIAAPAATEPPPAPVVVSDHPLAGRIWHPASGRWLSPDEVAALVRSAPAVLLGETHDNPDHHALQAWVVRAIAGAGVRPRVAFEMIDDDRQPVLDGWSGDADGLGAALAWAERGWPDWTLYRPIAAAALAAGGQLAAANLPPDLTRRIARRDEPADVAVRLGLDLPVAPEVMTAMGDEIRASHCGMMPEAMIPAMVRVQRARDSRMAEAVAGLAGGGAGPAVLIAGAGHVRADRGVPDHLRRIAPDLTVVTVGFIEVAADATDPAAYGATFGIAAPPFEVVWFTGRVEREDPCVRIRQHLRDKEQRAPGG